MSEAALSGQHNYEVGLLQVSNSGSQFTEVLGLKDELVSDNLIPKEDAKFFLREQNEGIAGLNSGLDCQRTV